jgi:radical SAM superfamily enzyme YgiQ (UPF0313 family)
MKPILFVYPPYKGRFFVKSRPPFPLGILYIASYLEELGIPARVIDLGNPPDRGENNRFGWSDKRIREWFSDNISDFHNVIGVSSLMSTSYESAYNVARIIREIKKDSVIVCGGPHATSFPEHVKNSKLFDHVCIGEGEEQMLDFISNGKPFDQSGDFFSSHIKDMDSLPFINRELLINPRDSEELQITFSRGCPHKCSFCGSHIIQGRVWRHKSPERALEEIKYYVSSWGAKRFLIEDDNLCPGKSGMEWLGKVCELVISEFGDGIKFSVPHGIPVYATADKELCSLLWNAGFRKMVFPLESTDPGVLADMNKEFTPENWRKAITNWKVYEKKCPTEIILGYPFVETIDSMLNTICEISKNKCAIWASHFRPNKGILLFDRSVKAGYISEDFDPLLGNDFCLETERWSLKDLKNIRHIVRGANFGIENQFDVFTDAPEDATWPGYKFLGVPKARGDVVASGSFGFQKGQVGFTSILLTRFVGGGKPIVKISNDKKSLIYEGIRSSVVFSTLRSRYSNSTSISRITDFFVK